MRASSRNSASRACVVAAVICIALLAVAGCAPSVHRAPPDTHHVTIKHALYPHFPVYSDVSVVANQVYERPHGQPMLLDVCLPTGDARTSRPAIVAVHGGGWTHGSKTESDFRNVCEWLASAGYVTVSVNYRLAPKYEYPDAVHDVEYAVEWLRKRAQVQRFSIDPAKIGILGSSAGGNLAALVGTDGSGSLTTGHRVAAVVDLSGPTNLTAKAADNAELIPNINSYLGCSTLARCPRARVASANYHVDPTDPPFFVANSTKELIPLSQPESFVAALRTAGISVRFDEVEGDSHAVKMLHSSVRDQIIDFLHATLGDPRGHPSSVARR